MNPSAEMNPSDEILDIVDENDVVVGQAPRGEATARGLRHRCVFIEARDAEGRVFVHRRTATKLVFPSHYDMFVGGVVGAGESYEEAALREAEEELGVSGLPARSRSSSSCTRAAGTPGGRRSTRSGASCRYGRRWRRSPGTPSWTTGSWSGGSTTGCGYRTGSTATGGCGRCVNEILADKVHA